ncbi:hypothetical protein Clacol_001134 [Clathrus columnatus]|uniref:Uncharacterized protein n=1 Tax=Clathrus columnatus TaxID=1419009 RepID=A0AAV5A141_9AGAM|nr:hypothetical protein Clacol_001134 [Clathrus columnatus]
MNATSTSAQTQAELVQALNQAIPSTVGSCLLGSYLGYFMIALKTLRYLNAYFYLIKNFGNSLAFLHINWSISSSVVVTLTMEFIVQSIYAHRAYILGGRKLLIPAIIIILGLAGLGLGLTYEGLLITNNNLFVFPTIAVGHLLIGLRSSEEYLLQRDLLFPAVQMLRKLSVSILE